MNRLLKVILFTGLVGVITCVIEILAYGRIKDETFSYIIGIAVGTYVGSGWNNKEVIK